MVSVILVFFTLVLLIHAVKYYLKFNFQGAIVSRRADGNFDVDPKLMGAGKGLKAILGGLGELWDQSQYAEEYNLNQFLARLNG